jgi:hypothetical protein
MKHGRESQPEAVYYELSAAMGQLLLCIQLNDD